MQNEANTNTTLNTIMNTELSFEQNELASLQLNEKKLTEKSSIASCVDQSTEGSSCQVSVKFSLSVFRDVLNCKSAIVREWRVQTK